MHAPGYVVFSGFSWAVHKLVGIVPTYATVTTLNAATNLFTLLMLYSLGRRLALTHAGALASVAVLGSAQSLLFASGYAKHSALTAAFVVATFWLGSSSLLRGRPTLRGAALGLVAGLSLGVGWYVVGIAVLAVLVPIALQRRGAELCGFAMGAGAGVFATAALVLWSEANGSFGEWGHVTSFSRMFELWLMTDYRTGLSSFSRGVGNAGAVPELADYATVIARDLGLLAVFLAVIGLASGVRPFLKLIVLAGVLNVIVAAFALGVNTRGDGVTVRHGGFLVVALCAVSLLAGRGVERLLGTVRELRGWVTGSLIVAGMSIVIAMNLASVWGRASDLGNWYGSDALHGIPSNSVVITWTAERSFPLHYALVHQPERRVIVVMADGLSSEWYREQLRSLGLAIPPMDQATRGERVRVFAEANTRGDRLVFLDSESARHVEGTTPHGLLEAVGQSRAQTEDLDRQLENLSATFGHRRLNAPANGLWPNADIAREYTRAARRLGVGLLEAGHLPGALAAFQLILTVHPQDAEASRVVGRLLSLTTTERRDSGG